MREIVEDQLIFNRQGMYKDKENWKQTFADESLVDLEDNHLSDEEIDQNIIEENINFYKKGWLIDSLGRVFESQNSLSGQMVAIKTVTSD